MTDEERKKASIEQIGTYCRSQYSKWHIAAVKSIKKIMLDIDEFYKDISVELEPSSDDRDIVYGPIRNGLIYEAVVHCIQSIEELFALVMCLKDYSFFARDVVVYSPTAVKDFIRDFDCDNIEDICLKFRYPYFELDKTWENKEVFDAYKEAVLLTKEYLNELKGYHKRYYEDYCQYKHGLSVGLNPMETPLMKKDTERHAHIMDSPLKGALFTFHNYTVDKYKKRTGEIPAPMILLKPAMQKHLSELSKEGNLLYSVVKPVDIEETEKVTAYASILIDVLWNNIINICENDNKKIQNIYFPTDSLKICKVIGFPVE